MSGQAFQETAIKRFAAAYPETPIVIDHGLSGHPSLRLEALVALARRMRPVDVEYNRGDLPIGIDPSATPGNGMGIVETIESIERANSWMVLKFVEQDAEYRALLHETLAELAPSCRAATGEMLKLEGFIFISSPNAVTPFHFDPEHNILLQIRGNKRMTVFPASDPETADGRAHEAFHGGGHRNLPWRDEFAAKGTGFDLVPGKGIYVPVKAPHWVQNGSEPSISFSITWRSEWSYHEEYAHGFNRIARGLGLSPAMPGRFPHRNAIKSTTYRAIRRAKMVIER